jgi:LysR family transcriptional regulator (chromosome initiation inhibitor)
MHLDPAQLAALTAILRFGSFEAAAHALAVTPSAISQRLKALEEKVGATLILRAQPCTATPLGARLAKHAQDVALLEAQALGLSESAAHPQRLLSLAVPADSLATWLIPALAAVDGLMFDLRIDDQDNTEDWLRNGSVSAAVTAKARAAPGCDVHVLGHHRYIATASPAFVQRYFRDGVTADALGNAPMLTYSQKDQLQNRWIAENFNEIVHPPSHMVPSTHGFVDAALLGLGWGMNPHSLVEKHLTSGHLIPLIINKPFDVALYWQVARVMVPALAPLSKSIVQTARKSLHRAP